MAACEQIEVISSGDLLVTWEPVGEIRGFADGSDGFMFEPSDETGVELKMASDGTGGSISGNDRNDGKVTLKLKPGVAMTDRLWNLWYNGDKYTKGQMTATNIRNGRTFTFPCAGMAMAPGWMMGDEATDSYDFEFWVSDVEFTGSQAFVSSDGFV